MLYFVHKKYIFQFISTCINASGGKESKFEDSTLLMAIKMKPKPHNCYKHVIKMI